MNIILFQPFDSHRSYLFDQHNFTFKCFLVNTSSSVTIHPLQFIRLVVCTNTKFHRSYSSIPCLAVFFAWAFAVLVSFLTIQYGSFWGQPYVGQSKILPELWNLKRVSEYQLLGIPSSFAVHIHGHIQYLNSHFLKYFRHDFRRKNFHYV